MDPGDRDLLGTATALIRPDRHVRDGERHERVERNFDEIGGRRRRRPLHARRSYVVRVELSRNQGRVRVVEIRQRADRIGVHTGIVGVRVEYLDPAIPLHFVDEIALHRSAIGGGLRFRPLELHVVVRREDGGESSGGARRPSARGFQRHVDGRRPGGAPRADVAHGHDVVDMGLAPLEIRIKIGQRSRFADLSRPGHARPFVPDLEVRERRTIGGGHRRRPLEQRVVVRRQLGAQRPRGLGGQGRRRHIEGHRRRWIGQPGTARCTHVEHVTHTQSQAGMGIRQRIRRAEPLEPAAGQVAVDHVAGRRRAAGQRRWRRPLKKRFIVRRQLGAQRPRGLGGQKRHRCDGYSLRLGSLRQTDVARRPHMEHVGPIRNQSGEEIRRCSGDGKPPRRLSVGGFEIDRVARHRSATRRACNRLHRRRPPPQQRFTERRELYGQVRRRKGKRRRRRTR